MIPNTVIWFAISAAPADNKNFIKDKDYVIHPNVEATGIVLLDQATGRLMEMTLQGGLHQAIEIKEGLKLTQETRAMKAVQNLFKMFRKLEA